MSHPIEAYEMQASTSLPATSTDEDQDEQVWRDVKAETGYSSYESYVKTLAKSEYRFGHLLIHLDHLNYPHIMERSGEIFILNIQKDGSTVTIFHAGDLKPMPPRPYQSSQLESGRKISTQLLQNLRSPPEDIPARIVLWSIPRWASPHASIIEALGLGLDIDPLFFESLSQFRSIEGRLLCTRHQIIIGDSIATVAQGYGRERHAPPILIIAGYFDQHFGSLKNDENLDQSYYPIVETLMNQEIRGATSLFRSAINRLPPYDLTSTTTYYYLKLLSKYVYKDCYVGSEVDALLLIAALPLLRLEIFRLRSQCSMIGSALRRIQYGVENPGSRFGETQEELYNKLDKHRFWLRRRLEGLQESRDTLHNLARPQNAPNWLGTKTWASQEADIGEALAMARNKELEVRDYMQLQIGNLSISESRKSIQLSNQQMKEASRGKKSIQSSFIISVNRVKSQDTYETDTLGDGTHANESQSLSWLPSTYLLIWPLPSSG